MPAAKRETPAPDKLALTLASLPSIHPAGDYPAQLEYDWTHWSGAEEGGGEHEGASEGEAARQSQAQRSGGGSGGGRGGGSGVYGSASGSTSGSGRSAADARSSAGGSGMRGNTDGGTYARGSGGGRAGRSGGRPAAAGQGPVCHPKYGYFPESDPPNSTLVLLNMASGNWRPSKAALFDLFRPYGYLTGGANGSCLVAHCCYANQLSSHDLLLGYGCPAPGASALLTLSGGK